MLGVRLQTQNNFVYGELGRVPLINKRIICVLKYWFKILQSDDVKYIKIVYDMLLHDHDIYPEKKSWVKSLKDVLDRLGFSDVWFFQGVGDIKIFLSVAKQRISDMFLQTWSSEMENTTRGRTYRLFSSFQLQPYLNFVNVSKFRMALTRFRVSAHRLEVEAGRWHKPEKIPFQNRKCKRCNVLEDEFHFLLECPMSKNLRKQYIKK